MTEEEEAEYVRLNDVICKLEDEVREARGELDDLLAFLKVASWRYGGAVASKYAEGWRACAVAALDWIDKHQERGTR